jgi:hypothetical protein
LAYFWMQPVTPSESWLPAVQMFLEKESQAGPFRRVWFFDFGSQSIVYSKEREVA